MIGNEVTGMEALTVTVFSMVLVFLTLFAISLILDVFKVQNGRDQKIQAKKAEEKPVIQESDLVENLEEDEEELVAVISAALMETLNTTRDKLIIRNIRQINDPTWAQTGRIENMN